MPFPLEQAGDENGCSDDDDDDESVVTVHVSNKSSSPQHTAGRNDHGINKGISASAVLAEFKKALAIPTVTVKFKNEFKHYMNLKKHYMVKCIVKAVVKGFYGTKETDEGRELARQIRNFIFNLTPEDRETVKREMALISVDELSEKM